MVDFPILEEFKNFIYYNLETIFLIVVPLAGLIGWLSNRVASKIKEVESDADMKINELKGIINTAKADLTELDHKLSDIHVDVSSDISAIKAVLNIGSDVESLSNRYRRKKRSVGKNNQSQNP